MRLVRHALYGTFSVAKPLFLSRSRKSDTLFVLGSGYSINDITDWRTIEQADSVGFNFWLIHDFIPTYYFHEAPPDEESLVCLLKLIGYRAKTYRSVRNFNKVRQNYELVGRALKAEGLHCQALSAATFGVRTVEALSASCTRYRDSLFRRRLQFVSQGVASIELIVVFSWLLGYRKVVLCGVDLNNSRYFYEHPRYAAMASQGLLPPNLQTGPIHKTNDPASAWGGIPVKDVLDVYQRKLLINDSQIHVENPASALAEIFPVYALR